MAAVDELLSELSDEGRSALLLMREMSDYYRRLLRKLELDSLTGLPGSNKYHELIAELTARPPESVGFIVFDVNDLKRYNDTMGHHAGDLLLQRAAESFHAVTGDGVRIFRTGGDEFVAVMPDCSESGVDAVVAKWREALAELNAAGGGAIRCTIAHGIAFGTGEYALAEVMKFADERMYDDKRRMKESGLKIGDVR
ncbi:MAG: GGDEF domain-containing protein [Chitinispirillales bacterium]|jgi:diguanylate cyclase (GGDEF)-like protein|nr:GGDEF domain-containing protein [Chitinispirillales bacterium]